MSNLAQYNNAKSLTNDEFLKIMAHGERSTNEKPRPKTIRINGQTGVYEARKWNQESKGMESVVYRGDGRSWHGIILMTKWFAKWKFDSSNKTTTIKTREFLNFDDSIELLSIDYRDKEATKVLGNYPDYSTFKAEYVSKDKITGSEKSPFDLWASLYILDGETSEVVNFKCKGTSRSNLFDYFNAYKQQQPETLALAGTITRFEVEHHEMPGDASKEYFAATFKAERVANGTEIEFAKVGVSNLIAWMKLFNEDVEEDGVIRVNKDGAKEIDINQVPY